MKQVNKDRVRQAIGDIEKSLSRLRRLGEVSLDEFLVNEDYQDIARSRLLTAMEAVINVCYHIVAKKFGKVPKEYAQCFKILAEENFLPQDLANRLALMCRFRNRLVHLYWEIDYTMVYEIIKDHLDDIENFVSEVRRHIRKA